MSRIYCYDPTVLAYSINREIYTTYAGADGRDQFSIIYICNPAY